MIDEIWMIYFPGIIYFTQTDVIGNKYFFFGLNKC